MSEPQAYRPQDFCAAFNISLRKFYKEVEAGNIRMKKCGRASSVTAEAAKEWLNSQPDYAPEVA